MAPFQELISPVVVWLVGRHRSMAWVSGSLLSHEATAIESGESKWGRRLWMMCWTADDETEWRRSTDEIESGICDKAQVVVDDNSWWTGGLLFTVVDEDDHREQDLFC